MSTTSLDDLSEVTRLGLARYDSELRSLLEPAQNGRAVALHVDTGVYVVADTLPEARREILRLYPDPQGRILSRIIGPEMNAALPYRLLSGGKR